MGIGGGGGRYHFAQLGHGGALTNGDHYGAITVSAGNDVDFRGGVLTDDDAGDINNAVQLGHGGRGYSTWGETSFGGGNASSTGIVVEAG